MACPSEAHSCSLMLNKIHFKFADVRVLPPIALEVRHQQYRRTSTILHDLLNIIFMKARLSGAAAICIASSTSVVGFAQVATTAGAITTPFPTTQSIAVDWPITGDTNNNGTVAVRYRVAGTNTWQNGINLFRIPAGNNTTGTFGSGNGQWANKHSGSIFDLSPGTSYEIELTLSDSDGGSTTKTTTVSTRPIPVAPANANSISVTPTNFAAAIAAAKPGDLLLLGAGNYPAFTIGKSGTQGMPIVLRGENVDTVIVQGRVTMDDQQYVYLENVTVQGEVRLHGASNMVVRGCKIRTTAGGITFEIGNDIPRNNYIVGNDVVGGATWVDNQLSSDGYNGGEGIQFTGSGHVICNNHVKDFRDDISLMEYDEAYEQVSIDICNNDIEEATDDAIEADSAMGNVRVVRNQIKNCFDGMSSQPDLGGPTYFIRNVMFNVLYSPFKFHNGTVGDVVFHNSVVKCGDAFGCYAGATWSRALFRNNLFIGGTGGGTYGGYGNGSGRVLDLADADTTCSFDYDGLGSIGTNTFAGRVGAATFNSLATLHSNTTEVHAVQVDLGVFASAITFPSNPYPPKSNVDLRLLAGSAAIDRGQVWPGLNEDFAGSAPDLGAYELGATLPGYGPQAASSGGTSSSGGAATGGVANTASGTGGAATGGVANTVGGTGGPATGGIANSAGGTGGAATGGIANSAGGTGGAATGGIANAAGRASATGGLAAIVGGTGNAGASGLGGNSTTAGSTSAGDAGSCSCRTANPRRSQWPLLVAILAVIRRRKAGRLAVH